MDTSNRWTFWWNCIVIKYPVWIGEFCDCHCSIEKVIKQFSGFPTCNHRQWSIRQPEVSYLCSISEGRARDHQNGMRKYKTGWPRAYTATSSWSPGCFWAAKFENCVDYYFSLFFLILFSQMEVFITVNLFQHCACFGHK